MIIAKHLADTRVVGEWGAAVEGDEQDEQEHIHRERLRWLGNLRWLAMFAAVGSALVAQLLQWKFVALEAIALGVVLGVLGNVILMVRTRREAPVGPSELSWHAALDALLLTWFLAFSGGLENPMSSVFSFHVVLGALLTGRRGMMSAAWVSSIGIFVLFILEGTQRLPTPVLEHAPPLLRLGALGILLLGLSYFSLILAQRLRSEEQQAREKRAEAEGNLQLLNDSLDALDVGFTVLKGEETLLKNAYARKLEEKLHLFRKEDEGRRLILENDDGVVRILDQVKVEQMALSTPLQSEKSLSALLYVDRTEELLVEKRHLMLERLATLGRALQGVAHELNTPLTTMQMLAKDLLGVLEKQNLAQEVKEDCLDSVSIIVDETRRCRSLTQSLLQTARVPREPNVGESALFLAQRATRLVGGGKVKVDIDEESLQFKVHVNGDPVLQVLMNLIQNAMKACDEMRQEDRGDPPAVKVYARIRSGSYEFVVEDEGGGLPAEVQERLFEPFVTTRAMGEGTGLGLYTSLVTAHDIDAELTLFSDAGKGTKAVLTLPSTLDSSS
ncbi:MAG: hypothetical protein GY822_00430 [Deltaproteobacteria bacterium]|nr:hypothetical protein [Deltaproteobacteria bacterium]